MSRAFTSGVIAIAAMLVYSANAAAEVKEDPLRPADYRSAGAAASPKHSAPSWRVNEILISESRRVAVVNDRSVKQGEYISGARVVAIEPGYVTLEYNNRLITARFNIVPVKRRVTARAEK